MRATLEKGAERNVLDGHPPEISLRMLAAANVSPLDGESCETGVAGFVFLLTYKFIRIYQG